MKLPKLSVLNVLTAAFFWNTFLPEWLCWMTHKQWLVAGCVLGTWQILLLLKKSLDEGDL